MFFGLFWRRWRRSSFFFKVDNFFPPLSRPLSLDRFFFSFPTCRQRETKKTTQ